MINVNRLVRGAAITCSHHFSEGGLKHFKFAIGQGVLSCYCVAFGPGGGCHVCHCGPDFFGSCAVRGKAKAFNQAA
jgi:hypothetical protein